MKTLEELLLDGSDEAMSELWARTEPLTRATARRAVWKLRLVEHADDLVQETYRKLMCMRGRPIGNVRGFLHRVVVHAAIDEYRRRTSRPAERMSGNDSGRDDDDTYSEDRLSAERTNRGRSDSLETSVMFWEGFGPYRDRRPRRADIFLKHYMEGKTTKELADEYDTSVAAIQHELFRARRDLRGVFTSFGAGPPRRQVAVESAC